MFTARSEFRIYLRPDNADLRLTKRGYEIGCVSEERYMETLKTEATLKEVIEHLKSVEKAMSSWMRQLQLRKCENHTYKRFRLIFMFFFKYFLHI